jgi:single-strand DNA-binding protein
MAGEIYITIPGRLTNDPELRFTPNGAAVANFTLAHNAREFDRQSNEWKDKPTNFFRCAAWRDMAENVAETLTKGMPVLATGEIKTRNYETKEGEKRSVQEIEIVSIGPDLRWGSAKYSKGKPGGAQGGAQGAGGGFGGQSAGQGWGGQQGGAGGFGGGGNWGGQPAAQEDPWATPGNTATAGGWGSGPDAEPPF